MPFVYLVQKKLAKNPVLRIRIRIRMFLGILDPDPDPLVRGTKSGSGSFYHQAKRVRKTLIPTALRLFLLFIFVKKCKCTFKK
jgi:hypothetical protein